MLTKNIIYIADFSLPNKSAYALHVLKMCDAFSEKTESKMSLFLPFSEKNYGINKIKNEYLLKNDINIKGFFKKKKKLNFLTRIIFALKVLSFIKNLNSNYLIFSRSIITSIILALFNVKNILEIHTELTGFTKKIFFLTKLDIIKNNLKFVFISKNLFEIFNIKRKNSLVLGDAVDHRDFNINKNNHLKNTCFYSGSFSKGKGLEIILKISKKLPNIEFHLFGNEQTIYDKNLLKKKFKNIHFKGFLNYAKLVKKIRNYKVVLMPYKKDVGVLIDNINVANYFSPLKMFDYLASGKIILASDLNVYKNVLKHNQNCIKIKENTNLWSDTIKTTLKSKKFDHLGYFARKDSKKYSWNNRVMRILEFYKSKI